MAGQVWWDGRLPHGSPEVVRGRKSASQAKVWRQRVLLSVYSETIFGKSVDRKVVNSTHDSSEKLGIGQCFLYLRNIKGFGSNHKRVYRIYRELEFNLRIKPKRCLVREKPNTLAVPTERNEVWSTDFIRERPEKEVVFSLPADRETRALDQIIERRRKPKMLCSDNGPEYISSTLTG